MPRLLKSLSLQILSSFLLIILATLSISILLEFHTYNSQLPRLVTELRTQSLAQHLSATYTRDHGWAGLNTEIQRLRNLESLNSRDETNLRIIVRDLEGKTLYNSFSEITALGNNPLIEGIPQPVVDYGSTQTVGTVSIFISQTYIEKEARRYALSLLRSGLVKVFLPGSLAVVLSFLFSRRITRPVIRLTRAARSLAESGKSGRIEIDSSDELGQLGNTFNGMIESLESQRNLRSQLINDLAHELNNPLNAIRLEARGLTDDLVTPSEAAEHIIREVDTLKNLVYDLDWLAETDSGTFQLNREEYDLLKIVREESRRRHQKGSARGMEIVETLPETGESLALIDPLRISAALGNLLDNAIHYGPEGGKIEVRCGMEKDQWRISVCDQGTPVPLAHRDKLFERFYRADKSRRREGGGRGLGLALVKKIAEMHGGRAGLECGDTRGNCFYFTVPCG